jgi:hypothetical protein
MGRGVFYPLRKHVNRSTAATICSVRQLPKQCESCKRQIATLETCVLPDGTEKRGAAVTFRESAEGGIRCKGCADGERTE